MRVFLKKIEVFCVNTSWPSLSLARSISIGPICRQETEKLDGSSLRPKGWPHPPLRACEIWQTTFGTCGSSKALTQTLSLGESRLKVVLMQSISAARAIPPNEQKSTAAAAIKSSLIFLSDSDKTVAPKRRPQCAACAPGRNASV